jgi:EAL domain-containing protein (putative c-di-GMP-specific phosphodiesterase class I)
VNGLHDTSNVEIIRAVVALAAGLSMNVTAEGIETPEQLAHLKNLDCDSGQGFLFDRPLSPEDTDDALRSGKWDIASADNATWADRFAAGVSHGD